MPTTERWIEWSKDFARPYKRTNYQLYLEVAQAACRYCRDSRGMSTIPELANADHYWLSRYFVFLGAGVGRDVIQTTDDASPDTVRNVAEIQYFTSFIGAAATGHHLVPLLIIAWNAWKCVNQFRTPPMGEPPPSAPSVEQMRWGFRGCDDGFNKDRRHADQMIWGWAMNRYLNTTLTIPSPPL